MARDVPLKNHVTDALLRSCGLDPTEWWLHQADIAYAQALKDMREHGGIPYVREKLMQALEEFKEDNAS